MSGDPGAGVGASAPWYRVVAIPDIVYFGSPERDYASILPAALDAAQNRRPFVAGWLSRGGGAPLELITNAGPLPSGRERRHPYDPPGGRSAAQSGGVGGQDRCELLFPWGAKGVRCADGMLADLERMVWAPCQGRQAPPLPGDASGWRGLARSQGPAGRPVAAPASSWPAGGAGPGAQTPSLFEIALTT